MGPRPPPPRHEVVPPSGCPRRTGDLRRPGDGLGGYRARPSTVDRLRTNTDGGCCDIATGDRVLARGDRGDLRLARRRVRLAALSPRADAARGCPARGGGRTTFQLEGGILVAIGGGLSLYWLLGGADFGGGVWDLWRIGPLRERERAL